MGAPKKPPGRLMRAAIRTVLGPESGRRDLSDEEIRQGVEEKQQQDDRQDGGERRV
jgi:hypothetical protein